MKKKVWILKTELHRQPAFPGDPTAVGVIRSTHDDQNSALRRIDEIEHSILVGKDIRVSAYRDGELISLSVIRTKQIIQSDHTIRTEFRP